jgi:hypothetical protein
MDCVVAEGQIPDIPRYLLSENESIVNILTFALQSLVINTTNTHFIRRSSSSTRIRRPGVGSVKPFLNILFVAPFTLTKGRVQDPGVSITLE